MGITTDYRLEEDGSITVRLGGTISDCRLVMRGIGKGERDTGEWLKP